MRHFNKERNYQLTIYIIKLLRFTLANIYITYNNKMYKHIYGCTVGSPVSAIVVNFCIRMEETEDLSYSQVTSTPKK